VDRDILPALGDLGYAGSAGPTAVPDPLEASNAPSPHQRAEELRLVMVARFFGVRKQFAQALATLERVLAINPRNHEALNRKGAYLMALGRTAEAIEVLERFTRIGPEWPNVWLNLALCYRTEKRAEQAERWARRALEADPRNRGALELVVDLLIDEGRNVEAAPFQARLLDL
jgi:tetratricopeptide (TPR) repeat protein